LWPETPIISLIMAIDLRLCVAYKQCHDCSFIDSFSTAWCC